MKVVIWGLCIFVYAAITVALRSCGVILGGIPTMILYASMFWVARTLCKKWDEQNGAEK